MRKKRVAHKSIITSRYWIVLSGVASSVVLLPLAVLLVNFAANPSTNPFDENGYGAVLWVLILSVPFGGFIFAVGALAAVAIEWISGLKRNRPR
jgi:Na+/H+ antiporter NhaD/arsenite permease-like protein